MMAHNTAVHKGTKTSPFEAMFGYSPNTVHWPNMEDIVHPPQEHTASQDALTRLQNNRNEIRDACKDALVLQQSQMLKANDRARTPGETRWRPQPQEKVWVRRFDTNQANPKLCEKVEPATVVRCVRPDVYEVSRTRRKKGKTAVINLEHIRPKISDVPEDDPNIADLDDAKEQEETFTDEDIAAVYITYAESAIEAFKVAAQPYLKKGIPFSLSFPMPAGLWAGTNGPTSTATSPSPTPSPPPPTLRARPRTPETTPPTTTPATTTPPPPPRKPSSPQSDSNTASTSDDTEKSDSADDSMETFQTPPESPLVKFKRTSSFRPTRLIREARNMLENEVFKKRTRSQRK